MQQDTKFVLNSQLILLDTEIEGHKRHIVILTERTNELVELIAKKMLTRAAIYSDLHKAGDFQVINA